MFEHMDIDPSWISLHVFERERECEKMAEKYSLCVTLECFVFWLGGRKVTPFSLTPAPLSPQETAL